jgi:chromosome segregation ATPase
MEQKLNQMTTPTPTPTPNQLEHVNIAGMPYAVIQDHVYDCHEELTDLRKERDAARAECAELKTKAPWIKLVAKQIVEISNLKAELAKAQVELIRRRDDHLDSMTESARRESQLRAELAKSREERDAKENTIRQFNDVVLGNGVIIEDLQKQLAEARKVLNDAATSLCTISQQSGRTDELSELSQIRGYAFSRYSAAIDSARKGGAE